MNQHDPSETRRRSRNQFDHENIANVEWITHQTHLYGMNHHWITMCNPKTWKKYSVGFVVVENDLTPFIGARVAQRMELITVNDENFILTTPPAPKKWTAG